VNDGLDEVTEIAQVNGYNVIGGSNDIPRNPDFKIPGSAYKSLQKRPGIAAQITYGSDGHVLLNEDLESARIASDAGLRIRLYRSDRIGASGAS